MSDPISARRDEIHELRVELKKKRRDAETEQERDEFERQLRALDDVADAAENAFWDRQTGKTDPTA